MIILYTTHCPKCKILEKKMNDKNIQYEMITDEDVMIEKGFMSAPMLEVDGNIMKYPDALKWIETK